MQNNQDTTSDGVLTCLNTATQMGADGTFHRKLALQRQKKRPHNVSSEVHWVPLLQPSCQPRHDYDQILTWQPQMQPST